MRYVHWPIDISAEALADIGPALTMYLDETKLYPHVRVELENLRNEARAMMQQIMSGDRPTDIDPLLR